MKDFKLDNLLKEMMDILSEELNITNAVLRKVEDDNLIMMGSYGYEDDEMIEVRKIREGISGLSASKNITIVINDLEVYKEVYFKGVNSVKSCVSVPIAIEDEVIGTLNVASIFKNNFDNNKIEIIRKITTIFKNALVGFNDIRLVFLKNFLIKNERAIYGF